MLLQAALSDLQIEFIDGVLGSDMSPNAIIKTSEYEPMRNSSYGSWRAHMNAVHYVVKHNLTSALILEDDVDWDIRIREQLINLAAASRGLTQPLAGRKGEYADPSYPVPANKTASELDLEMATLNFNDLQRTESPRFSPYGDEWDAMWLGHCGMQLPLADSVKIPKGRVVQFDDRTIPQKHHLWSIISPFKLQDQYPDHTRLVHHVQEGVCSLGYAVSQRGARRMLQEVALKDVEAPFDILLRFYCEGTHGRKRANCLTTQPSLFHHYRAPGPISAQSDISEHTGGYRVEGYSDIIRWSVRMNADAIMDGSTDYVDQYPDKEPEEAAASEEEKPAE